MYSSTVYSLTEGGGLGAGETGCFLAFFCVCVCVCVCMVHACIAGRSKCMQRGRRHQLTVFAGGVDKLKSVRKIYNTIKIYQL